MKIFGLDISLDHAGIVCLNEDGIVVDYCYFTTTKKMAEVDPNHSTRLSNIREDESKDVFRLKRMNEYLSALIDFERKLIPSIVIPSYYSFEGYSYRSQSTSLCQIAELTGYLKHIIFEGGGSIRIHDPLSVKLFAANKGNASKKEVSVQALPHFSNFPEDLIQKKIIKKKGKTSLPPDQWWEEYDGPVTDIADAYILARMLYMELQVRKGNILLNQLDEGERRIFLRVSKAYPVNILDRSFIHK